MRYTNLRLLTYLLTYSNISKDNNSSNQYHFCKPFHSENEMLRNPVYLFNAFARWVTVWIYHLVMNEYIYCVQVLANNAVGLTYFVWPVGVEPGMWAWSHVTHLRPTRSNAVTQVLGDLLIIDVDTDHLAGHQTATTLSRTLQSTSDIRKTQTTVAGLYDILVGITSPWRRTPWVVPLKCCRRPSRLRRLLLAEAAKQNRYN